MKIVEEETDETMYFLELLKEIDNNNTNDIENLIAEANELLSIIVASIKTARSKNQWQINFELCFFIHSSYF